MTSENVSESETAEPTKAASAKAVDNQLIDELVGRAQAEGLQLTGEGGQERWQPPQRHTLQDGADRRRSDGDNRAPRPHHQAVLGHLRVDQLGHTGFPSG